MKFRNTFWTLTFLLFFILCCSLLVACGQVSVSQLDGAFSPTPNYLGGASNSLLQAYSGCVATPDSSPDAVLIVQKVSSAEVSRAYNDAAYFSIDMQTNAPPNNSATAVFAEAVTHGGAGTFVEGLRSHGLVQDAGSGVSSGYGAVLLAGDRVGIGWQYLVGVEGAVFNQCGTNAAATFDPNHFSACFVATSGASNSIDAAFVVNPWNVSKARRGFYVAANSVSDAAFVSQAATVTGLDLSGGSQSSAAIALPNLTPIRVSNAAKTSKLNVFYVDGNNALVLGQEATKTVLNPFGKVAVWSLPAYGNNAAAKAGGLVAGDVYRTGGDPDVICVVH